jgi:hypothetical protein
MVASKPTLKHGIVHVNIQSFGGETFRNIKMDVLQFISTALA